MKVNVEFRLGQEFYYFSPVHKELYILKISGIIIDELGTHYTFKFTEYKNSELNVWKNFEPDGIGVFDIFCENGELVIQRPCLEIVSENYKDIIHKIRKYYNIELETMINSWE